MSRVRTLVVGANDVFLDSVFDWVTADARFEVVGRARTGSAALERIVAMRVDLLLMDVTLPDVSGFEIARRIKSQVEAPLVVLLSFHDNRTARLEAWAAGADGFVAKSETTECLMPLVEELLRKRSIGERETSSVQQTMPARPTDLTK